jgi:hypothetical protein
VVSFQLLWELVIKPLIRVRDSTGLSICELVPKLGHLEEVDVLVMLVRGMRRSSLSEFLVANVSLESNIFFVRVNRHYGTEDELAKLKVSVQVCWFGGQPGENIDWGVSMVRNTSNAGSGEGCHFEFLCKRFRNWENAYGFRGSNASG